MLRSLGFSVLAALAGCGSETSEPASIVRDSADITIVENASGTWDEASRWRLAESPRLDIGGIDAEPEDELFQANSGVGLPNGNIVVANSGSGELRFYDASGTHVRTVGGQGGGPGEFEMLSWIQIYGGDSLMAWDRRLRRGSVYDTAGGFLRSFVLPAEAFYIPIGVFPDGALLARETSQWMEVEFVDGVQRPSIGLALFSDDGEKLEDLPAFPADEFWTEVGPDHPHRWPRAFGYRTVSAVSDSLFWIGTGETFAIEGYTRDGRLVLRVRYSDYTPRSVVKTDLDRWVEETVAAMEAGMAEHMRPFFEDVEPPAVLPPYDRMLADSEGNLWVQHYPKPDDDEHTWTVFAADGVLLGEVSVPRGFEILDVGKDYVLGRRLDDLDIEHIQLYGLLKG